jgi:hypothetical protein
MACHHQKTPKILLEVSRDHFAHCFCKFPTTGKSPWITSLLFVSSFPVTPLYTRYPEILLVNPGILWAYRRAASFALRIIPHIYRGSVHPQLIGCSAKYLPLLINVPKILCRLLLLKFLPACIMVSSICQVIIVDIPCHYHSDSIDSTCVRILAIISRFLLIYPSGSDVILDMSSFLVNQSLIDWPSNSIQHIHLFIRASASDPPILES